MFQWDGSDAKLKAQRDKAEKFGDSKTIFTEESISREEKTAFLDMMTNGAFSRLLDRYAEYKAAMESGEIKKDSWGSAKQNSLDAWVRRHDFTGITLSFDSMFNKVYMELRPTDQKAADMIAETVPQYTPRLEINRAFTSLASKSQYDTHRDLTDEAFHKMLSMCASFEERYFVQTDPYEVAKASLKNHPMYGVGASAAKLGISYSTGTSGLHFYLGTYGSYEHEREMTLEEINDFIGYLDKLQQTVSDMGKEFTTVFAEMYLSEDEKKKVLAKHDSEPEI